MPGADSVARLRTLPHTIGGEEWSPLGLAVVVGLHVLALGALLAYQPTRALLADAAPVFVRLIEPEKPRPIEPPKPLPVEPPPPPKQATKPPPRPAPKPPAPQPEKAVTPPPEPVAPAQQIVVPESAPAPARIEAPAPPPEPPKVVEAPPPPAPVVAATPPPLLVPPAFNAAYLSNPPPAYPAVSRRQGEEGKVMVRVFVSGEGLPQKIELSKSSGFNRLDEAAMDTIRRWKFVPARQGDQAVAAWVVVPIVFTLNQ